MTQMRIYQVFVISWLCSWWPSGSSFRLQTTESLMYSSSSQNPKNVGSTTFLSISRTPWSISRTPSLSISLRTTTGDTGSLPSGHATFKARTRRKGRVSSSSSHGNIALFASVVSPTDGGSSGSNMNSPESPRDSGTRRGQIQEPSTRTQIRRLFGNAKDLERQGLWRQSAAILQQILHMDPTDAHSHLALARLEARRSPHNSTKAAYIFRRGTAACPNSIHLWQAWAVHEESHGRHEEARQLYERALEIDPYNPYVCHAFALMERKSSHTAEARQLLEQALQHTSTAALVCSLGELLISESEFNKARDLYMRHVLRLKTEREKTEVYLASAWLEERYFENFDRAEELIQMSLVYSPTSSVAQVALARLEGRKRQRQQGEHVRTATVRRLANTCINIERGKVSAQPEDGRVYNAWAHMEVKSKRFVAARKILQRGIQRYPDDYSLLQAAGKVEERMGNFTGARNLYSDSLRLQPAAPTLVAFALLELKHPEAGTLNFTKIVRLFEEALLLDPRHGSTYNAYARSVLAQQRNSEEARRIFKRGVAAMCPDAASIYHGYARLELALGNIQRARELLVEGLEACRRLDMGTDSPHRERARFLTHTLGMLDLNRNSPNDALTILMDGIDRYGNSSQLLLGAALCEVRRGNEVKARRLFERSVLNDERHAHAWQAWGVMEMRAGNYKSAKKLFECGIKSAPTHGALWQAYATMECRRGKVDIARALFERGLKMAPRHIPLYQSWASLELRDENFMAAKALITQALTRDKRSGSGWLIAAEIEERMGHRGLGMLLLRRGIECAPSSAELYQALGDSLVRNGKFNEARGIMEDGLVVDPTHAPLYHSLAELEARVGNVEALAQLNKRASAVFSTNALQPSSSSSDLFGSRMRASRSRGLPKSVARLAERIVEDDSNDLTMEEVDTSSFLDQMTLSSSLLEEGLVGRLLNVEEKESYSQENDLNEFRDQ